MIKAKGKRQKVRFFLYIFILTCILSSKSTVTVVFAETENKLVSLTKQIMEAKNNAELSNYFEELKNLYFLDNRYPDFAEFLKSLSAKKKVLEPFVNYYLALCRYQQLKYLEESQNWDDYFTNGNTYRDQLVDSAQKAIAGTSSKDPTHIYARLILWQFHKDQQDVFNEAALTDLMSFTQDYAKSASEPQVLKAVADTLSSYGQRAESKQLYKIYAEKITTANTSDDKLKTQAQDLYKAGNLELAQLVYGIYIERIEKSGLQKNIVSQLIEIARMFAYKDEGLKDVFYAEKVFEKLESLAGKEIFDEELIYLRAFNLEKSKEYKKAARIYRDLLSRFPATKYADEAAFKAGIISAYIERDIKTAEADFDKLSQKEATSPQVISSLYQLGLLKQWTSDPAKAKEYYGKLLEKAKDEFADTVSLTKERIKEIDEARPLEYNLQTFLDVSLKQENSLFDGGKAELSASKYNLKTKEETAVTSTPYILESGCMQVELKYLWSGHTGSTNPPADTSDFHTTYAQPGTKEINLVVVSASGIVDRNLDMVDVR